MTGTCSWNVLVLWWDCCVFLLNEDYFFKLPEISICLWRTIFYVFDSFTSQSFNKNNPNILRQFNYSNDSFQEVSGRTELGPSRLLRATPMLFESRRSAASAVRTKYDELSVKMSTFLGFIWSFSKIIILQQWYTRYNLSTCFKYSRCSVTVAARHVI